MAIGTAPPRSGGLSGSPPRRRRKRRSRVGRTLAVIVLCALVVLAGIAAAVSHWSGVALAGTPSALAQVEVQRFAGTVVSASVAEPGGRRVPLTIEHGTLIPQTRLAPNEKVSVDVVVRRPGWVAWALGSTRHERLTVRTPAAGVSGRWLTLGRDGVLRVRFDRPVQAVAYGRPGHMRRRVLPRPQRSITIGKRPAAGSVVVAAAPLAWERLSGPVRVSWFPHAHEPVVVASPPIDSHISPVSQIRLTFALPVARMFGSARPKLSPATPGRWYEPDDHTLVFVPRGFGAALGHDVRLELPRAVAATDPTGSTVTTTRNLSWTVPQGSTLRLEQLLAQAGYLPLDWTPTGGAVARTPTAQTNAAVHPPAGSFAWRYSNTPRELTSLWKEGDWNAIVRGAVMMFQHDNNLAVDGVPGPQLWSALLANAIAGTRKGDGYNYVYVHRNLPQSLNLWHNGSVILTSPGNTGVPAAPTQLGTFAVFEHIPVGTMSGTNPNGTHYKDPGIKWISYFNGGDALHAFPRASFGTPQSLGCVELPLASAAQVWPYTPIGTLVTIEN